MSRGRPGHGLEATGMQDPRQIATEGRLGAPPPGREWTFPAHQRMKWMHGLTVISEIVFRFEKTMRVTEGRPMVESMSVATAGSLSRADVADLVADLRRDVGSLTWRHERQEEPDTLGPGQDIITAVIEGGPEGILGFGAGLLLDSVVSTVRDWLRGRKSTTDVTVDITIRLDGSGEVKEVEAAVEDVPANIRVRFDRSE
jgi:hypothetical protein